MDDSQRINLTDAAVLNLSTDQMFESGDEYTFQNKEGDTVLVAEVLTSDPDPALDYEHTVEVTVGEYSPLLIVKADTQFFVWSEGRSTITVFKSN